MSPPGRVRTPRQSLPSGETGWVGSVLVSLLVVGALAGLAVVASSTGQGAATGGHAAHGGNETDFAPPEVTDVSRPSATTVELELSDNHDVDEDTIEAGDFEVTPGGITGISTTESGTDAIVELTLADSAADEAVTVSSADNATITDTNGNEFDPTGQFDRIVPAPEGAPRFRDATRVNLTTVDVSITDDEDVDEGSIDADDFILNRSSITNVSTSEEGSNASVRLRLDGDVGPRALSVGIRAGADIADASGTVMEPTSRTVVVADVGPIRLQSGSRVNETAVSLYFTDGDDVAESSFQDHDFMVAGSPDPGRTVSTVLEQTSRDPETFDEYDIAGVTAVEDGSNATVIVRLERPVDEDELLVRVRDGADIRNAAGLAFDPAAEDRKRQVVVAGMDGVAPDVERFEVTNATAGAVNLTLEASERLGGINITVGGAVTDRLNRSAFRFNGSRGVYESTYVPDAGGVVTFRVDAVTDESGNTRRGRDRGQSVVDREPPEVIPAVDVGASGNGTVVFDARHTTDLTNVTSYTWRFGTGTNATGERVARRLPRGVYTVSLSATDRFGHTATETLSLNLTSGLDVTGPGAVDRLDGIRRVADPQVRVERPAGEGSQLALVTVETPSPGLRVEAGEDGTALVSGETVTVRGLGIVPRRYEPFTLGVSTDPPSAVSDAPVGSGARAVGGFTVDHEVPDAEIAAATIRLDVTAPSVSDPSDIAVLRRHDGTWNQVSANVTSSGEGRYRLRVDSPGFSRFAVVAAGVESPAPAATTPTPSPTPEPTPAGTPTPTTRSRVVVRNATLSASRVDPGTTVVVNATVHNRGDGNALYTAGLTVDGNVTATNSVTVPAGENRTVSMQFVANETGTFEVAVNGTSAGEVTVGSGGGIVASVVGVFGFLPLGLLKPLAMFVGVPLLVVYLALKGLAIYLGY